MKTHRSALASLVLLMTVACMARSQEATNATTPSQAASFGSVPDPTLNDGEVVVEPGTYRIPASAWSVADFTVTFPDGWTAKYGHVYAKHIDSAEDELDFYAVVVDAIYADPCEGSDTGELVEVGPSVEDLAAALLEQPGPNASGPFETTLGGYPATRIDLSFPEGFDLKPCNLAGIGLQIWYSPPADKYFVLVRDGIASVYIVDVDGKRQVFLTQYLSATSDADVRELQTILDSIHIEP
jgi:hypothetical protein